MAEEIPGERTDETARPSDAAGAPDAATAPAASAPPDAPPRRFTDGLAIARRLARANARVIGFLPVRGPGADVSAIASELATALAAFVSGQIAVVAGWAAWDGRAGGATVPTPHHARVFNLVPPPCPDAGTATSALEEALGAHRGAFARVFVDLAGYARPGHLPGAAELVDGVVLVVPARRTWGRHVTQLARSMPAERNLGAIVVD